MRYAVLVSLFTICLSRVAPAVAAPTLTVTEARRGSWSFVGHEIPAVIYADPTSCEPVPWLLEWEAVPEPGRTIDAYRFGFDIIDLENDDAWDTIWCDCREAPPHAFFLGKHTFHVEVRDDAGVVTRGGIRIECVPIDSPALIVTEIELSRGSWVFAGTEGPPVSLGEPATDPPSPWGFDFVAYDCDKGALDPPLFRYGWDIVDPGDDEEWTPWDTVHHSPAHTLVAGTHTFMVEARFGEGPVTRGTILIDITTGPVAIEKTTWGGIKHTYSK